METWWVSLDMFEKIMWCIAIPASIIFVIQMVMTFLGMDADGSMDGDVNMDVGSDTEMPFQLFTFRNLINFFLGFSWTGISFYNAIESKFWLTLLSGFMGFLLVAIVMAIFYALSRTQQSGNIDIRSAVGLTATVYYPIPEACTRAGKIQVSIQGAVREYDAMTKGAAIPTGRLVRILGVVEGNILMVEEVI